MDKSNWWHRSRTIDKRKPKAGEIWTAFNYQGEQIFYRIIRIKGNMGSRTVVYELIRPYMNHPRLRSQMREYGMSKFISHSVCSCKGVAQYRNFSH